MIEALNLSPAMGAIQQQQPIMPVMQPQAVMPQAPVAMPYSPYMLPQASFPEDIQQKTLENLRMRLDEGMRENKWQRGEEIGNKIFTGIVAPAFAAFGGPGTSAGAVAAMNAAKQEGQQLKQNRMVEANQKSAAIKGFIDMYNTVGVKPLQKIVDDSLKQRKADADIAKTQQTLQLRDRELGLKEKVANNTQTYHDEILKLKSRGLDISEDKLAQSKELAEKKMAHAAAYARLAVEQQKFGYDAKRQQQMEGIQKQYATEQMQLEKFNSEIAVKLQEKDPKTGKYKYTDDQGNALNASQYQLQIDAPQMSEPISDEGLMGALRMLEGGQGGAMPQQAAPQQGAPQMSARAGQKHVQIYQNLLKQGVSPDKAVNMFIQSATTRGGMSLQQALQTVQGFVNGQ